MKKSQTKRGFTLLEMLIVIGIIGLLASIAVINFNSIRKSTQLSFVIDQVENIINETRTGGRLGKETIEVNNKKRSACWGIKFSNSIQQFITPYIRETGDCDIDEKNFIIKENTILKENDQIELVQILEKDSKVSDITIISKPPTGKIEIYKNKEKQKSNKKIKVSFAFKANKNDKKEWKTIEINTLTGETQIIDINDKDEN